MPGVSLKKLRRVYSHPVALSQCRRFFDEHPQIESAPFYDTAGSVKMLSEERPPNAAAIASEGAARIYLGKILQRNIEDNPKNFTRFFLLTKQSNQPPPVAATSKVSVTFSASNTPGSLFCALACLALRDLNIIKVESRPLVGQPWQYRFYLDFLDRCEMQPCKTPLRIFRKCRKHVRCWATTNPRHNVTIMCRFQKAQIS